MARLRSVSLHVGLETHPFVFSAHPAAPAAHHEKRFQVRDPARGPQRRGGDDDPEDDDDGGFEQTFPCGPSDSPVLKVGELIDPDKNKYQKEAGTFV
jgi:hypothetical protein